jgi:MinD-like ATPase involved in chromosome partitioning or flagellar assembly
VIQINIDVAAAAVDQLPVVMVKPDCTASQNYIALANEVIKREEKQERHGDEG